MSNFAFDYDLTFTRDPKLFSKMVMALVNNHEKCYLISGRSESERERTAGELYLGGLNPSYFEEICLFPDSYKTATFSNETVYKISTWKAETCQRLNINILFEDNVNVIEKVKQKSPNTLIALII